MKRPTLRETLELFRKEKRSVLITCLVLRFLVLLILVRSVINGDYTEGSKDLPKQIF